MMQAHTPFEHSSAREVLTGATADGPASAVMGSLFDLMATLRRGQTGGRATGPILLRLATEGPMRSCDLADRLDLDQSTVSRHVAALEMEGLVHREPKSDDRRAHLVGLTESGARAARDRVAMRVAHVEAALSGWDEEEVSSFARLLSRFAEGLQAAERTTA